MEIDKPISTPFYEYVDTIISLTQLKIDRKLNINSFQTFEFSLTVDSVNVLLESSKCRSKGFDIRAVMRFYEGENVIEAVKDTFPLHLKIDINGIPIALPACLPYDRLRPSGRRHPRPVDITDALCQPNCGNLHHKCVITWIPDSCDQRFSFVVHLVRRRSCEELTAVLSRSQSCTHRNILDLMTMPDMGDSDGDNRIIYHHGAAVTSLTCPVSLTRMVIPVRGDNCTHLQCFDCATYLLINFHKPSWRCPVCDRRALFLCLQVDRLILDVINDERSMSISKVAFNELGQWRSADDDLSSDNSNDILYIDTPNGFDTGGIRNGETNMDAEIPVIILSSHSERIVSPDRQRTVPPVVDVTEPSVDNPTCLSHSQSNQFHPSNPHRLSTTSSHVSNSTLSIHSVYSANRSQSAMAPISIDNSNSNTPMANRSRLSLGSHWLSTVSCDNGNLANAKVDCVDNTENLSEFSDVFRKSDKELVVERIFSLGTEDDSIVSGNGSDGKPKRKRHRERFTSKEEIQIELTIGEGRETELSQGGKQGKPRKSQPGRPPVGRPRKDRMAPPPTSALREITKDRIKARYLRKHPKMCC